MDSIKRILILILSLLIFANILIIIELSIKSENILNESSCKEVLLNLSNPFSYINKVTKPFLIQLVKNATRKY